MNYVSQLFIIILIIQLAFSIRKPQPRETFACFGWELEKDAKTNDYGIFAQCRSSKDNGVYFFRKPNILDCIKIFKFTNDLSKCSFRDEYLACGRNDLYVTDIFKPHVLNNQKILSCGLTKEALDKLNKK